MLRSEIWAKVEVENAQSKQKYGFWRDIHEHDQAMAVQGEYREWHNAYVEADVHGDHGEIAELVDLINVCCRRIQFLTGETDA